MNALGFAIVSLVCLSAFDLCYMQINDVQRYKSTRKVSGGIRHNIRISSPKADDEKPFLKQNSFIVVCRYESKCEINLKYIHFNQLRHSFINCNLENIGGASPPIK